MYLPSATMKKDGFARLYCAQCGILWDMPCPVHSKHVHDSPVVPFALASLPHVLDFVQSVSNELPVGVRAKCSIDEHTIFGPVRGILCPHSDKENFCYSLADPLGIANPNKCFHMESPNSCNWIKFVRPAANLSEHNVAVYASDSEVYLVATKEIARDDELKVAYSQKYAEFVGICDSFESSQLHSQEKFVHDAAAHFAESVHFMSVLPRSFPEDEETSTELASLDRKSVMDPGSVFTAELKGNDHRLPGPEAHSTEPGKRKLVDGAGRETRDPVVKRRKTGCEERIKRLQAVISANPFQFPRGKQYARAWTEAAEIYLQRKLLPSEMVRAQSTLQNAVRIYLLSYASTREKLGRGYHDPSLQRYMDVLEQVSKLEKERPVVQRRKIEEQASDSVLCESEKDKADEKTPGNEKKGEKVKEPKKQRKTPEGAESDGSCHRAESDSATCSDDAETLVLVTTTHLGSSIPWFLPEENVVDSLQSHKKPHRENFLIEDSVFDSPIQDADEVRKELKQRKTKSENTPRKRLSKPRKSIRSKPSMEGIHPCTECMVRFTSQELLDLHNLGHNPDAIESEQGSDAVDCPECGEGFSSLKFLVGHVREHKKTYQPRNQCSHCQQYYAVHCMARHMKAMHPEVGGNGNEKHKHDCDKCGKEYPSARRVLSHVQAVHMPKSCLYCAKMYGSWVELGQHVLTHRQPDGLHCPNCSLIFPEYRALSRHHKAQHNVASIRTCPICDRMFKSQNRLGHHMLSHTHDFKFVCGLCGKRYKTQSTMQYHKRWSHGTGLKEMAKEKYVGTGKEYKAPRKRMQYEEFKYKCEECRLGFLTDGRLVRHRMKFHNVQ